MENKSFLAEIAEIIYSENEGNFIAKYVVLPNKRAKIFLQNELKKCSDSYFFAPQIWSIEELIYHISNLNKVDAITLLFEFYEIYKENTALDEQQDFETFSGWAKMLLQDFNDIDTYLIDPELAFSYLKNIDDITHWSVQTEQRTTLISNYLNFWETLPKYYSLLTQKLIREGKAYSGLQYRIATQKLTDYITQLSPNSFFYFCGFNALNKAEEIIFQEFANQGIGKIFWNTDEYFLNDIEHEAGYFARAIKKQWPLYKREPFKNITKCYQNEKHIAIISTPKFIGQAKIAADIIRNIAQQNENLQNTAWVLADENLLLPALHQLPIEVDAANITMGYSVKNHPIAQVIDKILKMQAKAAERKRNNSFYYQDVLAVFSHPLLSNFKGAQQLVNFIHKNNLTFFTPELILKNIESAQLIKELFESWSHKNCIQILDILFQFIEQIKVNATEKNDRITVTFAFSIYQSLNKIRTFQEKYNIITSIHQLSKIYTQIIDLTEVAFEGEPLEGLQIMGLLESRALDFKNVIITSVNEGHLPSGKKTNTFIPYDLKLEWGLPTHKEKDAIFAYHFYHLLHRAENIYIIYNSDTEGKNASEPSRYITQLLLEHPKAHHIITKNYYADIPQKIANDIVIHKTPSMMQRLMEIATIKGFSPSSLATYMRDPIQFYFQRVLKINDVDEVEENMALNTFGNIVHHTLEDIYQPFLNKLLTPEMIAEMIANVVPRIQYHFQNIYSKHALQAGKNLIALQVAEKNIMAFLQQELEAVKQGLQIEVLALEVTKTFTFSIPDIDFPIKIGGNIDRIEKRNGVLNIIDFKTGKVEQKDINIATTKQIFENKKQEKALQLLCYALMCQHDYPNEMMQVSIYSFKNKKRGLQYLTQGKENTITQDLLTNFKDDVSMLINEILDINIPFKSINN